MYTIVLTKYSAYDLHTIVMTYCMQIVNTYFVTNVTINAILPNDKKDDHLNIPTFLPFFFKFKTLLDSSNIATGTHEFKIQINILKINKMG